MRILFLISLVFVSFSAMASPVTVDLSWQPIPEAEAFEAHCWRHNIDALPAVTRTETTAIQFTLEGNEGEPMRCRVRAVKTGLDPSPWMDITAPIPAAPAVPLQKPEIIEFKITYGPVGG